MNKKEKSTKVVKSTRSSTKEGAAVKKKRHVFFIQAETGSTVSVAGSFNDWKPNDKIMKDKNGEGTFQCTVLLAPGSYQYKFCINETWCIDPNNPKFTPNDMGTLNSVLDIE
ncbi:MAG: glycogen-binding domain-containing protein [Victivallaceae bacterium]|jgi:1,4-alpha-glucan branching enzyme|nr:glycogen-binding domain-containing protein [Victivallaceae bacterium]NLK83867.1 glycoside hydrolase [Lentisphaerota bacterium]MDD3115945.1 glycogen-binding domain-containing protein [Victivallaceae bacterium]MDD3704069.1 glycogen-binding domain-containing protein [Victivallaceae bacterium]MDD4317541.1 glycogen-binding domain-containing protein [Victivallaceae bacterium]